MLTPEQEQWMLDAIRQVTNRETDEVLSAGIRVHREGPVIEIILHSGPLDLEPLEVDRG